MKYLHALLMLLCLTGCQITETIHINSDGSGSIELVEFRDENSYMQLAGDQYSREEIFQDTTYVFQEYIKKYKETFLKYTSAEQQLFQKYYNVKVHLKKSSFEKEFRTTITQNFNTIAEIPDLYKIENYANDLKNNYALTAEDHYYQVAYTFDGKVFKRQVTITNQEELQKQKDKFKSRDPKYASLKLTQSYILRYHFPGKIKSVSNEKAVVSSDQKSLALEFQLSDCVQNPEMTSLDVILE